MDLRKEQYWTTDRIMKLILAVTFGVILILLLNYLSRVLLPFVVACFVAYLMEPLLLWNLRWTHINNRVLGAVISIIEVSIVIGVAIYFFMPSILRDIDMLGNIIREVSHGQKTMPTSYRFIVDVADKYFDAENFRDLLTGSRIEALLSKGSSIIEESIETILHILEWLLTFIYIFFILVDYPQIVRGFKLIFPKKYRAQGWSIVREVQKNMNNYFRGQGFVAMFATVFYCVGFSIVGLPLAIPMGILVGILYMIPYFQYITLIPVALICLIFSLGGHCEFLPEMGKCILVYFVSQCVCDYIITPHVMGKEMGLNPAMILLSLSVWGTLLGIIGMIIALPATSLIMTYYERYISNRQPRSKTESDNQPQSVEGA